MDTVFTDASSVMTAVSLFTFLGIVWWAYRFKRPGDFDEAAQLPFADEPDAVVNHATEKHHG